MTTHTIELTPGETAAWLATITEADGTAQSLAALSAAWFTVKATPAADDPGVIQATLGTGLAVLDAAAGTLRITLSPTQTGQLADGRRYRWDLRLKFADGTVSNPDGLAGTLIALRRITRAN